MLETTLEYRGVFVLCFLAFCLLSLGLFTFLGQDFFPQVDAGQVRLHVRGRPGLRVEETARLCDEICLLYTSRGWQTALLHHRG